MKIACLHTAQVHVATFSDLFAPAVDVDVTHHVAADLLARAQYEPVEVLKPDMDETIAALSEADLILCTCSTLGPLAEGHPNVMRVDVPAMQAALTFGPEICVAICLESTRAATLDLLYNIADDAGHPASPRLILCNAAWPHFEAGDQTSFAESIASTIREDVARDGTPDCILLAQASMRVAAPLLEEIAPVLTTPERAVEAAIQAIGA